MKVILAFDSFKGSLSALQACKAAEQGLCNKYKQINTTVLPLSDGGEGLVQCFSSFMPLEKIIFKAHDPLMRPIEAVYAIDTRTKTAYMEMASTSGLTRLTNLERHPLLTTTYGVGEMIIDAIGKGCQHIVMGIGGSATCDGGKGMLMALEKEKDILPLFDGLVDMTVVCDVNNPLYGPQGAAFVFGPQKGANPSEVIILDNQLRGWAKESEIRGVASPEDAIFPGSGAAGGLGYALHVYLHATLKSGIDVVLDTVKFDDALQGADLVLTGEGKSDVQTLMGKVAFGVLQRALKVGVPVMLVSGAVEDKPALLQAGFSDARSINEGDDRPLEELILPEVAQEKMKSFVEQFVNIN